MPRTHDRQSFFKYASCASAECILNNGTFKCPPPTQFNDPFDHYVKYQISCSKEEIANLLYQKIVQIVTSAMSPQLDTSKRMATQIMAHWHGFQNGQLNLEHLNQLKVATNNFSNLVDDFVSQMNEIYIDAIRQSRVFCVSENNYNVVMWSHYGDEHRGVAFELRCADELDDNLIAAKQITYCKDFPLFFSPLEIASHLIGENPLNLTKMAFELQYYKHSDWSYEKEWRVCIPWIDNEGEETIYLKKDPSIFKAIYLGCRIKPDEKEKIIGICSEKYPHMEIYESKLSDTSFNLEFSLLR